MNEKTQEELSPQTPLENIIAIRREKLARLRALGIKPYPARGPAAETTAVVRERFNALGVGESATEIVTIAGRVTARRDMGKASFIDITDPSGRLQVYMRADVLGDAYTAFRDGADISDHIAATGPVFRTRTGEVSVKAEQWTMLAKSIRPLPEKWHGLKDTETRYRQRYLDLLANPAVREVFVKRSRIVSTLRAQLESRGFLEVETPMMQAVPGGAAARPFETKHNALGMTLFLRIAPELYLKRLVVGGMERVFEIGRNFRNEGIDRNHNPEFTMLELYQAHADYSVMMDLCETLLCGAADAVQSELPRPFRRARLFDLLAEACGRDLRPLVGTGTLAAEAARMGLPLPEGTTDKKALDHIFDMRVMPRLDTPTFVTDYPSVFSPLAKPREDDPGIAERFELYINGMEIANAYSELNDPDIQRANFTAQVEERRGGDDEAPPMDDDFITAIEHGLPPTGGLGIGIDRLAMVLCKVDSVREVILFPTLRTVE